MKTKFLLLLFIILFNINCNDNSDLTKNKNEISINDSSISSRKNDDKKPLTKTENYSNIFKNLEHYKNIESTVKTLKAKYCFESKSRNKKFINISQGEQKALEEYKKTFRTKNLGGGYGNLEKIKKWANNKEWHKIHHTYSHYDWWMFPNDRDTRNQGMVYSLDKELLDELLKDKTYIKDYLEGVRLVLLSWGWDLKNAKFIDNPNPSQKWTKYPVRLMKIIYSLILTEQINEYESVCKFATEIIKNTNNGIPITNDKDWRLINRYARIKERLQEY